MTSLTSPSPLRHRALDLVYCTVLYCMYCTVLHCTVCTALYCTVEPGRGEDTIVTTVAPCLVLRGWALGRILGSAK